MIAVALAFSVTGPAKAHPDWKRVAECETHSRWNWGALHRPGEGNLFEGGLGFAASTWRLWAGQLHILRSYPHAFDAPPKVQVRVAEYGWERGGYWGCLRGIRA